MVNVKSAIAFGLLAATASAATVNNGKRHAHHKRHNKKPCTTGTAPYPVNNGTVSTSTRDVVTVSVVPVPVTPTGVQQTTDAPALPTSVATQPTGGAVAPPAAGTPSAGSAQSPPPPAASSCAVETAYVTVQQTVTVTAGRIPETTSSAPVVIPSTSTSTKTKVVTTSTPAAPAVQVPSSSAAPPPPAPVATTTSAAPAPQSSAPAPQSSSSAPVSSGPGSYSGKKMGTSWNPGQNYDFSGLGISIGASWCYDWGQVAHGVPSGVEYVPSVHDADKCSTIASDLAGSGASYLKHFNEPEQGSGAGGSGLSPGQAASLHTQYIAPLMSKYSVGLPSVTSNNIPGVSGTGWLEAFVKQVGCKGFSFADFHWYGGGEDAATQAKIFLSYVDNWISTVDELCPGQNLPIWISEVSATPVGDTALASQFMAAVGKSLEENPRVARYAYWFPNNSQISSALSDIAAALSALGLDSIIG